MSLSLGGLEATTLDVAGGRLRCGLVPWDRESFGFEVAVVLSLEGEPAAYAQLVDRYSDWCADRQVKFSSARIPLEQRLELSALQAGGFEFQELVLRPSISTEGVMGDFDPAVGLALPSEQTSIEAVAGQVFVEQRFHVDPRFPDDLADRRYADWIQRSWEDPSDGFLVLRHEDQVAGFWVFELAGESAYLHLTAITPGFQGKGLGRQLWTGGASWLKSQGAREIRTTVSAANLPVVALYGRLGWRFSQPEVTLHRWHGA